MTTHAKWIMSPKQADAVIDPDRPGRDHKGLGDETWNETDIYGGRFVCESVCDESRPLILAAPRMYAALESVLTYFTNVNTSDPATVAREVMAALEAAGASKADLDAAAVALVRGPCSLANLADFHDSELEETPIIRGEVQP